MRRDYHRWYSERLGRDMELLAYGHAGAAVLVFPTSQARFYEYEDNGMIYALAPKIDGGQLRVYCVDSVDSEGFYNRRIHPHDRMVRYGAYENYIIHEVLPFIKDETWSHQVCTTGCSLGAYHALNFALKHPDTTFACIAMSGAFDISMFMNGYYDNDFYFNNPVDYVPNQNDPWFLDRYRQMKIVLGVGDHDICLGENFRMAHLLGTKGIPHWLDIWTGGLVHDWPLWRAMAVKFF